MPIVKNSNIIAVKNYSMAVPCRACERKISSITLMNMRGHYKDQIDYYTDKAISPHSHA